MKIHCFNPKAVLIATLIIAVFSNNSYAARKRPVMYKTPPDLTKGGKPDDSRDWKLGPIGANGWCFTKKTRQGASSLARQILITAVDKDGPAAGKLMIWDVILGTNGKNFTFDARKALAKAINEAEKEKNQGQLPLKIWRDGKEINVTLSLQVMGSYSKTAPFNCPKTDKIIDQAVEYLKDKELKDNWLGHINGLGLLATGRKDVMPKIKAFAHSMVKPGEKLSVEKHVSMKCWHWAYKTVFLCEYYLATGDKYVLPTITEYATAIAKGQSGAGTWGHTYAARENNAGKLHGHLGGYGAINQIGLTCLLAIKLADECGVKNNEIKQAIKRGNDFFSYFIGKGTIPYGDHGANNEWFDDNGKSGQAAIFFNLMGNRKGREFFCDMILGSTPNGREEGHTGHFWSHMWGGIGVANGGGEKPLQVFMKEMNPIFTLERQPNGRMAFQDNAGEAGEKGDPKTKWDSTGARLLQLCVPRRKLYLTGRKMPAENHLKQERIDWILRAGRLSGDINARKKLTLQEILDLLKDPLPPIRSVGAKTLSERKINCVDQLIKMLDSNNKYERYGAAEALCKAGFGNKQAADKLIKMMEKTDDVTFKCYAIAALINRDKKKGLLTAAKPAIPVLLKMAVQHSPDDPRRVLQHDIGRALFYNGRAQPRRGLLPEYGMEGVDRSLLVPAIKEILKNKNGWARSTLASYIYPRLTNEELKQLWGDIYLATQNIAPSGIMFASGVRTQGLKLMADQKIEEGLDLATWYIRYQKEHGNKRRIPDALNSILKYGSYAKRVIPQLESHAEWFEKRRNPRRKPDKNDPANLIREAIKKINAMPDKPAFELISIEKYIKNKNLNSALKINSDS